MGEPFIDGVEGVDGVGGGRTFFLHFPFASTAFFGALKADVPIVVLPPRAHASQDKNLGVSQDTVEHRL